VTISTRTLTIIWCVLGVVVWCAVFDWWMDAASNDYLLRVAHHELGRGPEPVMTGLLAEARVAGMIRATIWGVLVMAAGLLTVRAVKN
jgi:hypothetical protein